MNEFEFFAEYIGNKSELDSLYITLTSDIDFGVSLIKPLSMTLSEKLDRATPSVIFDFVDGNGDLANHNIPQMDATFTLTIGRSIITAKAIKLRMTKIMALNSKVGSQQVTYRMFLVHSCWDKLIGESVSRGWRDQDPTKVVESIARECGWDNMITNPCDSTLPIIQPNWTNMELIKWITNNTTILGGKPRYAGRIDGSFLFNSIQGMVDDQSKDAIAEQIPLLRMEGQDGEDVRSAGVKKNNDIPPYFTTYKINESHAETRMSGGGGIRSYTYNSHTDTFMIDTWGVKDLKGQQMSDWVNTSESMVESNKPLYTGRGSDNKSVAMNRIASAVDDAVEMTIALEGSIDTRVGMMLEIIIPIPQSVGSNEPFNIMYSGFWMVSAVNHGIDFGNSSMMTNAVLIRSGHDSKQLNGFTTTEGGKFVKRDS